MGSMFGGGSVPTPPPPPAPEPPVTREAPGVQAAQDSVRRRLMAGKGRVGTLLDPAPSVSGGQPNNKLLGG